MSKANRIKLIICLVVAIVVIVGVIIVATIFVDHGNGSILAGFSGSDTITNPFDSEVYSPGADKTQVVYTGIGNGDQKVEYPDGCTFSIDGDETIYIPIG